MIAEFSLASVGLIDVRGACERRKWNAKSVQNWINAGLLPACFATGSKRRTFLLRIADVDAFTPPPRGRPKPAAQKKPAALAKKPTERAPRGKK